ncbi:HAD family hydrolase [Epidermidibacterium keratini]|uniref:HAD family hydrolase n=1 Tax=Epidermidibacterium keratini TaxID=1891644 RepID=UPI001CEFA7C9|nr:HAD family hydrolase [Epidermidibacterium keratini]
MAPLAIDTAILDVDGTLIDSNYHHALAWSRAFDRFDYRVPLWRIHRTIGMGGDKLVTAVAGEDAESRDGDALRDAWTEEYDAIISEVAAFDGATELMAALRDRGITVVLASSGIPQHTENALKLLDDGEHLDASTTSEDAEESKPDPELLDKALEKAGGFNAIVIGDSVWDMKAAKQREIPAVALLCGGFGRDELLEAGAAVVLDDPRALLKDLGPVLGDLG